MQTLRYELASQAKSSWYSKVRVRQSWEDEQDDAETDWGELFFDLNYVAMAFQLGTLISDELELVDFNNPQDNTLALLLLFFTGPYLAMFDAWNSRMIFMARFIAQGAFHKIIDIIEGVTVAVMAFSLATSSADYLSQTGFNYILVLSIAKLTNCVIQCGRYLEVAVVGEVTEDEAAFAKSMLSYEVWAIIPIIAAVVTSSLRLGEVTAGMWLLSALFYRASLIYGAARRTQRAAIRNRKVAKANELKSAQACSPVEYEELLLEAGTDYRPAVPVHVRFTISRIGEFSMLMMGEGVLQTIILPIISKHEDTQVSAFVLSALVLSFIQLINFRYLPYEPEEHAIRRSISRGLVLFQVTAVYQASLIWVGVGLKTVLKAHYKLAEPFYTRFAWLYCASLATSILALIALKGLNMGVEEMFYSHNEKGQKAFSFVQLGAWCLKVSAAVGVGVLPLANLYGNALLGSTFAILLFFFVLVKFRVGVEVGEEVQQHVYSKEGLVKSIENMMEILQGMRETVTQFDLENLDDEKLQEFKQKFLAQVARLDEAEKHEEEKALELVSLYLEQNRNGAIALAGTDDGSAKVLDSGNANLKESIVAKEEETI